MSPALDFINGTAETTVDVSAAATASATAVALGKSGLPNNLYCNVLVTEASAANFQTRQLTFYFEYTTDGGTTYHRAGAGGGKIGIVGVGVPKQGLSFPIGLNDIVTEQNAASDIKWRVTADIGSTLSTTDDFNFQAYIGNQAFSPVLGIE